MSRLGSFMFGWFKRRRRKGLMRKPLPPEWLDILHEHVPFFAALDSQLRDRFLNFLKAFVGEKYYFGAGGLEVTDEHRVVIAAAAVRLVLHLDLSYYDRLTEIIIYPYDYRHPDDDGAVLGEASRFGTVVFSWPAVLQGLRRPDDGLDTAAHEFAHVLDLADGAFDGTPPLHRFGDHKAWSRVMSKHFFDLRKDAGRRRTLLRAYGATDEAEFFAVATEVFFEKPVRMRAKAPDLYEELCRFYAFDPAGVPRPKSAGSD